MMCVVAHCLSTNSFYQSIRVELLTLADSTAHRFIHSLYACTFVYVDACILSRSRTLLQMREKSSYRNREKNQQFMRDSICLNSLHANFRHSIMGSLRCWSLTTCFSRFTFLHTFTTVDVVPKNNTNNTHRLCTEKEEMCIQCTCAYCLFCCFILSKTSDYESVHDKKNRQ